MTAITAPPWLAWVVIVAITVGTFAARTSFIVLFGRLERVPPWIERLLTFVPPAALAALVLPGLLFSDGSLAIFPGNERLIAGTVGGVVAWRTKSLFATVAVGMVALWTVRFFV